MRSKYSVYADPNAAALTLTGLKGVATLDAASSEPESLVRTGSACPDPNFLERRVVWLIAQQYYDESTARVYAAQEQRLRLMHTSQGPLACNYTYESLRGVCDILRAAGVDLLWVAEIELYLSQQGRTSDGFYDISTVFAPYIPLSM